MRTRSSRLFIVLIHIIGVSTTIPGQQGTSSTEINKYAVILERLLLDEDGLDALLRRSIEDGEESDIFAEPFWIQDQVDGLCLTPFGFSDCGDASMWYIRPDIIQRKRTWRHRNKVRENFSYGLEYVNTGEGRSECLLTARRRFPKENATIPFGSCESQFDRAFSWNINKRGILYSYKNKKASRHSSFARCLWRHDLTSSTLAFCSPSSFDGPNEGRRLAKLSLIRHESAAAAAKRVENRLSEIESKTLHPEKVDADSKHETSEENNFPEEHILGSKDKAHSQASEPSHHHKIKASKKFGGLGGGVVTGVGVCTENLCGTNKRKRNDGISKKPLLKLEETKLNLFRDENKINKIRKEKSVVHSTSKKVGSNNDAAQKLRRIEIHPYIATAKNEVWIDPQTGLQFPTDLCRYLGHDRKSAGRHTLTGMGYYTKTIMNIKIYGVGLYVSKRDILADPLFQNYASLNAMELRSRPDFYDHLRNMPSQDDSTTGFFDRTIFIKLNMQLSVTTMQSSLRATWKLLTEEAKNLLINSSMEPRAAEKQMLDLIENPENSGRCACGQVAPPEYQADSTCCARGTELVFTWRKNGDLEVRVDGRVMDIFQRPDVARGIFYEYLRLDDPMSVEFLDKVVSGFPFLLGPLSQMKGMPISMNNNDMQHNQEETKPSIGFGIRTVGNFVNTMTSHASTHTEDFADWVQTGANNAGNAARALGDSAKQVAEGIDRRRDQLFKHVSMLPENGMNFVKRRLARNTRQDELAMTVSYYLQRHRRGEILMKEKGIREGPRGKIFRSSMNAWFGLSSQHDDLILPVSRNDYEGSLLGGFLFMMVHLYLLLMLIVSLPGIHEKRLMKRSLKGGKCAADTIGTCEESCEESSTASSSLDDDNTPSSEWMIGSESLADDNLDSSMQSLIQRR